MISVPLSPGMNNRKLEVLITQLDANVEGQLGFWQFEYDGYPLICITDEDMDRMRIMTPIVQVEQLSDAVILECMNANFDRALDARYCINNGTLWGAFIHPLTPLNQDQFHSACSQVAMVSRNFGTSFSSGGLAFNTDIV